MPETLVGKVTHYFGRIGVAVVRLSAPLSQGDTVYFRGKFHGLHASAGIHANRAPTGTRGQAWGRGGHQSFQPSPRGRRGLQGHALNYGIQVARKAISFTTVPSPPGARRTKILSAFEV